MKNVRFHLIYLALIGFLAFQYWTKAQALDETVGSIEQFDKVLKSNNEVIHKTSLMLLNEIEKSVQSYYNQYNMSFLEKARNETKVSGTIKKWVENLKTDFIISSGGYDKKDSTLLANRFSTKSSSQFFSDKKIKEIRDSLTRLQSSLTNFSDSFKVKELQKQYVTYALLGNDFYWHSLKNKTAADGLAQLTFIQNQIELDEVSFLNYIYNNVGWVGLVFDQYKVAIAPQKAAIFEGESFKADIYLAEYSSK